MTDIGHLIDQTRGRFFSVTFVKANGEIRKMLARTGVRPRYTTDRPRTWNPADKGLRTVWDMQKSAYRNIPVDRVVSLTTNGETHVAL